MLAALRAAVRARTATVAAGSVLAPARRRARAAVAPSAAFAAKRKGAPDKSAALRAAEERRAAARAAEAARPGVAGLAGVYTDERAVLPGDAAAPGGTVTAESPVPAFDEWPAFLDDADMMPDPGRQWHEVDATAEPMRYLKMRNRDRIRASNVTARDGL